MKPGCRAQRRRLSAYLDRRLEPAERAELERHLDGCEPCRAELARLRAVGIALAEARRPARVPSGLAARAHARAVAAGRPAPGFWDLFSVAGRRAALAGAVAAALVWGGLALRGGTGGASSGATATAAAAPAPVDPAEAAVALWAADGTVYGE